jgi:hypothetical protein
MGVIHRGTGEGRREHFGIARGSFFTFCASISIFQAIKLAKFGVNLVDALLRHLAPPLVLSSFGEKCLPSALRVGNDSYGGSDRGVTERHEPLSKNPSQLCGGNL